MNFKKLVVRSLLCASLIASFAAANISPVSANNTQNVKVECQSYAPGTIRECASVLPQHIADTLKGKEFDGYTSKIMHFQGKAYLLLSMGTGMGGFGYDSENATVTTRGELAIVHLKPRKIRPGGPISCVMVRPLFVISVDDPNAELKTVIR